MVAIAGGLDLVLVLVVDAAVGGCGLARVAHFAMAAAHRDHRGFRDSPL